MGASSMLWENRHFVQQFVEAIKSSLEIDLTVVDRNHRRVAGTGPFYATVGRIMPPLDIFAKVMLTGTNHIIDNPRIHESCRDCPQKDECPEKGVMVVPIRLEGEFIGGMSLVAFSDQQKEILFNPSKRLDSFLDRMCQLLGSGLLLDQVAKRSEYLAAQLSSIMDNSPFGIIAVDHSKVINACNGKAERILQVEADQVVGTKLGQKIKSFLPLERSLEEGVRLVNTETALLVDGRPVNILASVDPLRDKSDAVVGAVAHFLSIVESRKKGLLERSTVTFDDIVSCSRQLDEVKEIATRAAQGDSNILLTGETGTGKEVFARAIHSASNVSGGPFVAVNCGAIPENLMESELYGYDEGAFTGAKRGGKRGKFEMANGGTLFLDEVGDLPLHMQVKLLRAIQERAIERVGGTRLIPVSVRIISATNKDLAGMTAQGFFREDLYYRLNVIPILIPPLRHRVEDIPRLATHFLNRMISRTGFAIEGFAENGLEALLKYPWPGNVRELESAVEYAVTFCSGRKIAAADLPPTVRGQASPGTVRDAPSLEDSRALAERELILSRLRELGSTTQAKTQIARDLGVSLSTLYRRIRQYGIQ